MAFSSFLTSPLKRELREDLAIEIYVDESSQTGHKYLVIGAMMLSKRRSVEIFEKFSNIRGSYTGEVKWKKLSDMKAPHYRRWVDGVFELIDSRHITLHFLSFDTTQFDHKTYNDGDGEIGFSKLVYQLLLHHVGKPVFGIRPIYGYLDSRTTKHNPENLRLMLNAGLSKHHNIHTQPFRRLTFRESCDCDLIQALDLFIGALAWERNKRGEREEARQCKQDMSDYIMTRSQKKPTKWGFKVWDFNFGKKGSRQPRS